MKLTSNKNLIISKEEILKTFQAYCDWWNDQLTSIEKDAKLRVDKEEDIEAIMPDGKRYWILTTMGLKKFNKSGEYEVFIHFDLKEDSKYSPASLFAWDGVIF